MPVRRKYTLRKRTTRRRGRGFFQNIGSALSKAHDWIKSNKIISTVGKALGSTSLPFAGIANTIGNTAEKLGYGRHRRVGRPRVTRRKRGGNLRSILSSVHRFVKDKKLVSGALSHFGHSKLASTASSLGYGRKRKTGGSLRSILSSVHRFVKDKKLVSGALSHFGHSKLSSAASSLGYGKRRRRTVRHRGGSMRVFPNAQMAMIKW